MQKQGIEVHSVHDEMALFDRRRGMAFSLNTSATAIWELCDGTRTISEIAQELGRALDHPGSELFGDVALAVGELHTLDLLEITPKAEKDPS